jgi:probable addiction module antidote protein
MVFLNYAYFTDPVIECITACWALPWCCFCVVVQKAPKKRIFEPPSRIGQIIGGETVTTSRKYRISLITALQDPQEAAAYLDAALEEGDRAAFLLAIRNVIDALGGMTQIARDTGLNRENLYRILSRQGNPELNSLEKLLKCLGLRLAVEVDQNLNQAA